MTERSVILESDRRGRGRGQPRGGAGSPGSSTGRQGLLPRRRARREGQAFCRGLGTGRRQLCPRGPGKGDAEVCAKAQASPSQHHRLLTPFGFSWALSSFLEGGLECFEFSRTECSPPHSSILTTPRLRSRSGQPHGDFSQKGSGLSMF